MPVIFKTDSGIFQNIEASNMLVTGEIKVGTQDQTINEYITQEVNTTVGAGIDYSLEINTLSGNIDTVSGDLSALSGIVDGLNVDGGEDLTDISGNLNIISGRVDTISGDLIATNNTLNITTGNIDTISGAVEGILNAETADDTAFNTVSGSVDIISGNLDILEGVVDTATGNINQISGVVQTLNANSSTYGDADVETYLGGRLETHIIPSGNALYDIGEPENKIRHLYLSDNSLYIGGEGTNPGTQISATSQGAIVFPSGVNISGAIGDIQPNAENDSIQWNNSEKKWVAGDKLSTTVNTLDTTTGDLYNFYKKESNNITNVSANLNTLNIGSHDIPTQSSSLGQKGDIAYSGDYLYICIENNKWKRTILVDF